MITVEKPNKVFKPVSITLTFHDQESLNKMASMFNYSPVCDYMESENSHEIRKELVAIGGNQNNTCEIHNFIKKHPCIKYEK